MCATISPVTKVRCTALLLTVVAALGPIASATAAGAAEAVESVPLGAKLADTAVVSGSPAQIAAGHIVFRLFILQPPNPGATQECTSANLVFTDTVPVPVGEAGTYTSAAYQTVNTGRHQWVATYFAADGTVVAGGTCPDPREQTMVITHSAVLTKPRSDPAPAPPEAVPEDAAAPATGTAPEAPTGPAGPSPADPGTTARATAPPPAPTQPEPLWATPPGSPAEDAPNGAPAS